MRNNASLHHRVNIRYPPALPILREKKAIQLAILKNQVIIICGATGSGKSTQIPKMCLEAGRGKKGKIACTQPRRIAAVTIAHRIAEELGETVGGTVGYKIRFEEKISRRSIIKIMTDGILLAETQHDPQLRQYDTIIIDEAHERSLNIDFILGILVDLLKRRKDLKLIITSATLDSEKFSRAFSHAPVIEVSERMYPVEVRYRPPDHESEEKGDLNYIDTAVDAIEELLMEETVGDVLVFMPTEQDIRDCCEMLKGKNDTDVRILPLYARLPWSDQKKVFQGTKRKVIVATNVAETSLTIPGIRFVIDTGLARILCFNPGTGTTSLPILPISQSSANQRAGRCGRIQNGVCVRLYDEDDYHRRPKFNTPEILRSNLAGVILQMLSLNLPKIQIFPFIDRPAEKAIRDGFNLLHELGAIEWTRGKTTKGAFHCKLTDYGRLMALLPIDPRVSRMIIEGRREKCLHEVIVIASALSIRDPRERPAEKEKSADEIHGRLKNTQSDFLTMLDIWRLYREAWETRRSEKKMRVFCREFFLSYHRMREWRDIYHQIVTILQQHREYRLALDSSSAQTSLETAAFSELTPDDPPYEAIHKSIVSGYLSNIAQKKENKLFLAARNRNVFIFPGSGLFSKSGRWIVAAEYVETSKPYARTVANIKVEWLEKLGDHLCKRTYTDPHWDAEKGEVRAYMQVSLFGLVIVPRRRVAYGNIDPDVSESVFLEALVDGDVSRKMPFLVHNQRLIARIRRYEEKIRKRNLLISRDGQIAFYRRRTSGTTSVHALRKLIFQRGSDDFLRMSERDLLIKELLPEDIQVNFPDSMQIGGIPLQLSYALAPGSERDGVTMKVPISALSMVVSAMNDPIIPGLRGEKIHGLLKSLPKAYRVQLHPIRARAAVIHAKFK